MKRLGKMAMQTLLMGRAFLVPSTPKMIDGFLHMRKGSETKKMKLIMTNGVEVELKSCDNAIWEKVIGFDNASFCCMSHIVTLGVTIWGK